MSSLTPRPPDAESIFREAMRFGGVREREEFLASACGADASLLAAVRALLRSHLASEGDPAGATLPVTPGSRDAAALGEKAGDVIGRYTLLRALGEGGFGSVWAAEQREPVRREVALKIVKLGMDTREVVARFEQERQALAVMDHPNIAKVLDGGATPSGRPYFVMELVKGDPLTRFCDQRRLSLGQRLDLFIQVCQAVQHAHQKGIIHRDLKPSNILVSLDDKERPVPRVIDFGIAKAVAAGAPGDALLTQVDQFIGTPAYMSPEQAGLGDGDIDTRSDIYSLGVMLYELLAGAPPFDPADLRRAGLEEMQRRIREEEPPRPSTRLGTVDETRRQDIVERRRTPLSKLVQSLRGDLDWIVMKALEKDRARRYASASDLALDLERHLRQEPVTARPPSAGYRLGKFVRRNKGPVAASAAIALLLIGGLASTTLLWLRENAARRRAEAAEDRALIQTRRSEQIAKFMEQIFAGVSPEQARGMDKTLLKTLLDTAAERIRRELGDQPEVEAELRNVIGEVYRRLGLHDEAMLHLRGALERRRGVLGAEHPDTLTSMSNLALLHQDRGELAEAEALLTPALGIARRVQGGEHLSTLSMMANLGVLRLKQGNRTEAGSLLEQAIPGIRRHHGADHPDTLKAVVNRAEVHREEGQFEKAIPLFEEVMASGRRVLGTDHPVTLAAMNGLGVIHLQQGRPVEAEPLLAEVAALFRRTSGDAHPHTLVALSNLALAYQQLGKLSEAEPILSTVLESSRRNLGEEHQDTLASTINLALLYQAQNRADRARPLFITAMRLCLRLHGPEHPLTLKVGRSISELGTSGGSRGAQASRETAALALEEVMVEVRSQELGEIHPLTQQAMCTLALRFLKAGLTTEGEAWLARSLGALRRAPAEARPALRTLLRSAGELHRSQGRLAQAEACYTEALQVGRGLPGGGRRETIESLADLASLLRTLKKPAEAEPLLVEELQLRGETATGRDLNYATAAFRLGLARSALKRPKEAEAPAREALELRRRLAPDSWQCFQYESYLGGLLLSLGRPEEAEPLLLRGYEGLEKRAATIPTALKNELVLAAGRLGDLARSRGDVAGERRWAMEADRWRPARRAAVKAASRPD